MDFSSIYFSLLWYLLRCVSVCNNAIVYFLYDIRCRARRRWIRWCLTWSNWVNARSIREWYSISYTDKNMWLHRITGLLLPWNHRHQVQCNRSQQGLSNCSRLPATLSRTTRWHSQGTVPTNDGVIRSGGWAIQGSYLARGWRSVRATAGKLSIAVWNWKTEGIRRS